MDKKQQSMDTQNNALSTKLKEHGAKPTQASLKDVLSQKFQANLPALASLSGGPDEAKRLFMAVLNVTSKNALLLQCSPSSIFQSLMQCAELKLYPGPLQEAALVPFWSSKKNCYECTFMPQYQGLLKLATNSAHTTSIYANVVHENDEFYFELGSNAQIKHRPAMGNRGEMLACYAIAKLKSGGEIFEVMDEQQVNAIRSRSQAWNQDQKKGWTNSPWSQSDSVGWMWRKTVLKQLTKLLPKSIELAEALEQDNAIEVGEEPNQAPLIDLVGGIDIEPEVVKPAKKDPDDVDITGPVLP